jgi:hypothetical protein
MKSRKPLLSTLAAGALLFAGSLLAQDMPPPLPPPPPAATEPAMPPAAPAADPAMPPPASADNPAMPLPPPPANPPAPPPPGTLQTPQGEVTVHSSPAPAPVIGPAPSFEQLSGGRKAITEEQAIAYPPLANDFINADTNRNGSISKAEYAHWMKQL